MAIFELLVRSEIDRARKGHEAMSSAHEAYSIILEELDEFWDQVRLKRSGRNPERTLDELVQIASLAQCAAEDLGLVAGEEVRLGS